MDGCYCDLGGALFQGLYLRRTFCGYPPSRTSSDQAIYVIDLSWPNQILVAKTQLRVANLSSRQSPVRQTASPRQLADRQKLAHTPPTRTNPLAQASGSLQAKSS